MRTPLGDRAPFARAGSSRRPYLKALRAAYAPLSNTGLLSGTVLGEAARKGAVRRL